MRYRAIGLILTLLLVAVGSATATPVMSLGFDPATPTIDEPIPTSDLIVPDVEAQTAQTSTRAQATVYRPYELAESESTSVIPEPTTFLLLGLALAGLAAGRQLME